ncbi:MAG TPA: VOC family protein [Puia sp.]|jgi:predicted enzyme related to lactoylglutathione lyase|nr:VOC family protein [Puia sp.]
MNRVVHFEIHAINGDRMQAFYQSVFGWDIKDMGPAMGNYRIIDTGKDETGARWTGINGGLTPRHGDGPEGGEPVNAYVCTISVANIDDTLKKIEAAGGTVATDKMEVPGVGHLAYRKDPEGNIFGVLQPTTA